MRRQGHLPTHARARRQAADEGRRVVRIHEALPPQGQPHTSGGLHQERVAEAVHRVHLVGDAALRTDRDQSQEAESGLRERHPEDLGRDQRPVGEFVARAVVGKVEAPERGENHPRTHHSGRVQEHVDSRVLERQLLPRLLNLNLASDAHEIAHPRGGEEV